jgi:hypothetical protein
MMERRLIAAALMVPLIFASPALAQRPADDRGDISMTLLGPTYLPPARGAAALPGFSAFRSTERDYDRSFAQQPGQPFAGTRVVGAWPIARDVQIGIGLLSVSRYSAKEPDFKRAPMKDVGGRRQRIAAIGVSFGF